LGGELIRLRTAGTWVASYYPNLDARTIGVATRIPDGGSESFESAMGIVPEACKACDVTRISTDYLLRLHYSDRIGR